MLTKVQRRSVTDTIIDQVAERIRSGQMRPGDVVPNELVLSEQLGVSRSSVREALKAMQVIGMLQRSNNGTVISQDALIAVLHKDLRGDWSSRRLETVHLYEARRFIEGDIAALAALRCTERDLEELEALAASMEALPPAEFDAYFALDMRFHGALCEVAGNPVFTRIWSLIYELIQAARLALSDVGGLLELSNENHKALLEAIRAGDPDEARRTVHESLTKVETLILESI